MSIAYALFIIYLACCFWLIPKISFVSNANLSAAQTRLLLLFKVVTGVCFAIYFKSITNIENDYIKYNGEGFIQYKLLLTSPRLFFTDFTNDLDNYGLGGLFGTTNSIWANLRFNLLFKFIAILNLVSHGNFYLNSVIFSTLVFFGHIAFYRIYIDIYKEQKPVILTACFCIPSLLMYTSCIHKDGLIFLSLGIVSYIFYSFLSKSIQPGFKYYLLFLLSIATIFLFRNYVTVAILPAMLTAFLCKKLSFKKHFIVLIAYAFFLVLFFVSGLSNPLVNLPAAVVQRKEDFAALAHGNTSISMNDLQPTLSGFIKNFPQAFNHYFFRPYLWEFSQTAVLFTALELFVYQLIILAFIFYRKKQALIVNNFNVYGFALIFNMMLIIGYTIPNIGAIVRYRSIFWVFLICPALCNIDWKRLFKTKKA